MARILPFEPMQAIYHAPFPRAYKRPILLYPGVIISVHGNWAVVRTEAGATRRLKTDWFVHRGYCERCEVPAVLNDAGALSCPRCHGAAVDVPPPPAMAAELYGEDWHWPFVVREVVLGAPDQDTARKGAKVAYDAVKKSPAGTGESTARVRSFLEEYRRADSDDAYLGYMMNRAAGGMDQPDGPCDITRWLDRQMGA